MSCPYNEQTESSKATDDSDLRVISSIPKVPKPGSETSSNWKYPSNKMFYEAMKRKGTSSLIDDPRQLDIIVTIHNVINEQCWAKILEWEQFMGQ